VQTDYLFPRQNLITLATDQPSVKADISVRFRQRQICAELPSDRPSSRWRSVTDMLGEEVLVVLDR